MYWQSKSTSSVVFQRFSTKSIQRDMNSLLYCLYNLMVYLLYHIAHYTLHIGAYRRSHIAHIIHSSYETSLLDNDKCTFASTLNISEAANANGLVFNGKVTTDQTSPNMPFRRPSWTARHPFPAF